MVVWFATLALLGLSSIVQDPAVLAAVLPEHAVRFFLDNPFRGFVVLGAVYLVATGGEALYADLGHFGHNAIQLAWFTTALPALLAVLLGACGYHQDVPGLPGGAHTLALQAARDLDDQARVARASLELSVVSQQTGRHEAALSLAEEAAAICRSLGDDRTAAVCHFGEGPASIRLPLSRGRWTTILDSAHPRWGGGGSAVPEEIRSNGTATGPIGRRSFVMRSQRGEESG